MGIAIAWYTSFIWTAIFVYILFILSILFSVFIFRPHSFPMNKITGFGILCWFLCFGYMRASFHNQQNDIRHFAQLISVEKDSMYWWYAELQEIKIKKKIGKYSS